MNNEHQNELNNLKHRITILEHMVASSVSAQAGGVVAASKKTEENTQIQVPKNFHRRRTIV